MDDSMDIFREITRVASGHWGAKWPNLHFSDRGSLRLANTAGFLAGLEAAGQKETASKLAEVLAQKLDYLNSYGGKEDIDRSSGEGTIEIPRYRVILGDDGLLMSFSVNWYRAVSNSLRISVAEEIFRTQYPGVGSEDKDYWSLWENALNISTSKLKLCGALEIHRGYDADYGDGTERHEWRSDVVHYAFSFNGALIYRGPGQEETYSVALGDELWSIHT